MESEEIAHLIERLENSANASEMHSLHMELNIEFHEKKEKKTEQLVETVASASLAAWTHFEKNQADLCLSSEN